MSRMYRRLRRIGLSAPLAARLQSRFSEAASPLPERPQPKSLLHSMLSRRESSEGGVPSVSPRTSRTAKMKLRAVQSRCFVRVM